MSNLDRSEILNRIQDLMSRLFELDRNVIVPEARLFEDLDLDSIDAIDMVVEIQTMGTFSIDEKALKKIRTVGDVVDLVERLQLVSKADEASE